MEIIVLKNNIKHIFILEFRLRS